MIVNITTSFSFLLVLATVLYDFYSKKKVKSLENNYFIILTYLNVVALILDIVIYTVVLITNDTFINFIFIKILLIYYLIFMAILLMYFYIVSNKIKSNKNIKYIKTKKTVFLIYFITVLLVFFFPNINNIYNYNILLSEDIVYFVYFTGMVSLFIIFYIIKKNIKNITKQNYVVIFIIFLFGILSVIVQFYIPELLLIIPVHTLVILLIYFSIENPDLKLVKKLEKINKKYLVASNAKTEFLSNMSHEMRTPLNVINGLTESLLYNEKLDNKTKEDLENIKKASIALLETVGNILDIDKIENKKINIKNEVYNIKHIMDNTINLNKERLKNKDVKIFCEIDKNMPTYFKGDPIYIKTIFTNLISNACKYTNKGIISINLSYKNSNIIFIVKDTGIGISKSNQKLLFKKFSRLDLKNNIKIEGTGLGLAIVKELVGNLKGSIKVESKVNKGSIFTIILKQTKVDYKSKKSKSLVNTINLKNKKILIVDDNDLNILVLKRMLNKTNVIIDEAHDGLECLNKLNKNKYDLVLMDIMMPKLSGVETLSKISNKNFPIIAVTADALKTSKDKYIKLGFDDYIQKPVSKDYLLEVINIHI